MRDYERHRPTIQGDDVVMWLSLEDIRFMESQGLTPVRLREPSVIFGGAGAHHAVRIPSAAGVPSAFEMFVENYLKIKSSGMDWALEPLGEGNR